MYRVLTPPDVTAFTTLARCKGELQLTSVNAARDAWLEGAIQDASDAITDYVDRPLVRQRVAEKFGGLGRTTALLEITPIVVLESVAHDQLGDQPLSDERLAVSDAEAGEVWRAQGWEDDSPVGWWLTEDRLPQQGWRPWEATYVGGYLTRAHDIAASGVMVSGQELRLPAGILAPLLAAGEQVLLRGFPTAASNRRWTVLDRTDGTIVVDADLAVETAGDGAVVEVHTLPAALERACLDTVRSWYYGRQRDPNVISEKIGDWSATYKGARRASAEGAATDLDGALPASVQRALEYYVRQA